MMERRSTITHSIIPTFHRSILVDLLNLRPRKVGCEYRSIVLARARPADRAPLTHPDLVPGSGARRDQSRHRSVRLRHRQLKRGAREHAIRLWAKHRADVGSRNPHVAALEHDPQLTHASRSRRAAHRHVRNAL